MTARLLILTIALLASGCNKYGSEEKAATSSKPGVSGSPSAANNDLRPFVASEFALPAAKYTGRCDLNSVGGNGLDPRVPGSVTRSEQVVFNGWIVDGQLSVPAEFVIVLKGDSTYGIPATAGLERPDVAQGTGAESAKFSGFGFVADISKVPPGRYVVHLFVPKDGTACDTTKILDIN
ncbi:MAG: hypothetical protein LH470_01820 [Lysobacter sp.]|nr:hypothetical protein [Lysobacter sp.]